MANSQMRMLNLITEMQIKTTIRENDIPAKVAEIKKTSEDTQCQQLSKTAGGKKSSTTTL